MLYAVYARRDEESPYAIQENLMSQRITLVTVNVREKENILPALLQVFNKLSRGEFAPELSGEDRHKKLELLGGLICRVKKSLASSDRKNWYNSAGALIKAGFPADKLSEVVWA